jgi:hypothetical protein
MWQLRALIFLSLMLTSVASATLMADSFTDRRISVGLKIFRSLLMADTAYQRAVLPEGKLNIAVLYQADEQAAKQLSERLADGFVTLHDVKVNIQPLTLKHYLAFKEPLLAAYIAEDLNSQDLDEVIKHSMVGEQVLFSPFEGDVEKGVFSGLAVESSVRPLINQQALKNSKLAIKPFFLKVSKIYEP